MGTLRTAAFLRRPASGLAALLFACAPAPALRYASADPADRWEAGVRWHAADAEGLACSTAFAGDEYGSVPAYGRGRTLAFTLLLRNGKPATARIDPADFRLYSPRLETARAAVDPESVLAALDLQRRQALAGLAEAKALARAGRAASDTAPGPDPERLCRRKLADLDEERRAWSEGTIRLTDLDPGRTMSGRLLIFFPDGLPSDSLVLQWAPPGRTPYELGRYGRPRIAADEPGPLSRLLRRKMPR